MARIRAKIGHYALKTGIVRGGEIIMKIIITSILLVICFVGISFSQTIPNLEVSTLLSCKNATLTAGVTSRMLSFKDLDLRIGYISGNKFVMGFSYDMDNLEKIADISFVWEDTLLATVLIWGGLDFDTNEYDYGISMILVEVNFE